MICKKGPIGLFDSGFGGLTIFKAIHDRMPAYDYLYLGDNARAPYGHRSQEVVFQYTWECVEWLFNQGCSLVILACNTASAESLRRIQQTVLPFTFPHHRVLGVIRPTAEHIGHYTKSGHIGVLGTKGTVDSGAYKVEIRNYFPNLVVVQQACPMWVPLIENGDHQSKEANYFVHKYIRQIQDKDPDIDTLLLGCTHYPLIQDQIQEVVGPDVKVVSQGQLVAASLENYLGRHPEMVERINKSGKMRFVTTDDPQYFSEMSQEFFGQKVQAEQLIFRGLD